MNSSYSAEYNNENINISNSNNNVSNTLNNINKHTSTTIKLHTQQALLTNDIDMSSGNGSDQPIIISSDDEYFIPPNVTYISPSKVNDSTVLNIVKQHQSDATITTAAKSNSNDTLTNINITDTDLRETVKYNQQQKVKSESVDLSLLFDDNSSTSTATTRTARRKRRTTVKRCGSNTTAATINDNGNNTIITTTTTTSIIEQVAETETLIVDNNNVMTEHSTDIYEQVNESYNDWIDVEYNDSSLFWMDKNPYIQLSHNLLRHANDSHIIDILSKMEQKKAHTLNIDHIYDCINSPRSPEHHTFQYIQFQHRTNDKIHNQSYGCIERRAVAKVDIKAGQVLGVYLGVLCTEHSANNMSNTNQSDIVTIDHTYLHQHYSHAKELNTTLSVVTSKHSNIMKLLRDPLVADPHTDADGTIHDTDEGNARLEVLVDNNDKILYLVVYAYSDIPLGREITLYHGIKYDYPSNFDNSKQLLNYMMARLLHKTHLWLYRLESELHHNRIPIPQELPTEHLAPVVKPSQHELSSLMCTHKQRRSASEICHLLNSNDKFDDVPSDSDDDVPCEQAFVNTNCIPIQQSYYRGTGEELPAADMPTALRNKLKQLTHNKPIKMGDTIEVFIKYKINKLPHIIQTYKSVRYELDEKYYYNSVTRQYDYPECIELQPNGKPTNESKYWFKIRDIPKEKIQVNRSDVMNMIGRDIKGKLLSDDEEYAKEICGYNKKLITIKEVVDVGHPVRYYTPPQYKSYAVVAQDRIIRGTFLFSYVGQLSVAEPNKIEQSSYVFSITAQEIRKYYPEYDGEDLQLDAEEAGTISRFVNDNRFRLNDDADPDSPINVKSWDCIVMIDGM